MTGERRISRRAFIAGGLATAGAVVAGGAIAVDRRSRDSRTPGASTSGAQPSGTPARATPVPRAPFGVARMASAASFNFDTFDAQRTGDVSVLEVLGRTHSRMVDWGDYESPRIQPGLAASWEQPDATTVVLHVNPLARWHGTGAVPARPVTAADIADHFNRQRSFAGSRQPIAQRPGDYAHWSTVKASGASTVLIETDIADPFILPTLAGRFALIQPPEAVKAYQSLWEKLEAPFVVGSGAFRFDGRYEDGALGFTAIRGGHREASLEGLDLFEPGGPEAFTALQRDEFFARDRREAPPLRADARIVETPRYEDSPVISTYFIDAPPWNNTGLRNALSGALNRGWLAEALFGGRAEACGPVSPASGSFALDAAALRRFPGYGADAASDAASARAAWQAAGGPGLGTVTVDIPSVFDPRFSASSVVIGRLNEVLGPQFRPAVETYTTISKKTLDHAYGNGRAAFWFGWGPPLLEPDPSRQLLETYFSGGPNAGLLGLQPGGWDSALVDAAQSLGRSDHLGAVQAAQLAILEADGLGVIPWLLQRGELFRWRYWHGAPPTPYWTQHLDADSYLENGVEPFSQRPV